jgi:hypothetical protein
VPPTFFPTTAKATIAFSHARRNYGGWRCQKQQHPTQPTTTMPAYISLGFTTHDIVWKFH